MEEWTTYFKALLGGVEKRVKGVFECYDHFERTELLLFGFVLISIKKLDTGLQGRYRAAIKYL